MVRGFLLVTITIDSCFDRISDAINNLSPGESVTSTTEGISDKCRKQEPQIFLDSPRTISYTIQAPQTNIKLGIWVRLEH